MINKALRNTAIQRTLGYSYETEKTFQNGIKVKVTENMPPSEGMLKFLLKDRLPKEFSDEKRHKHTLEIGDGLRALMEEARARAE